MAKRKRAEKPSLAESWFAIGFAVTSLLLFSTFTYYMAFRFRFPPYVLATPPRGDQEAKVEEGLQGADVSEASLLTLTSPKFTDGGQLPATFTCDAGTLAVTPPLEWRGVPSDTVSLAVIVHDMEPRPRREMDDVLHWMVWNISATTTELAQAVPVQEPYRPDGSHQANGSSGMDGNFGYVPPCLSREATASHHYAFELFALDKKLDLPVGAGSADFAKAANGHILAHGVLISVLRNADSRSRR